jgi:predicted glycogen debranching enzyme
MDIAGRQASAAERWMKHCDDKNLPAVVEFGRDICGDLRSAEQREWLVTNGNGGFASGTVAGILTRRYHGLLIAALKPPRERTLLVTKVDETVEYGGSVYALGTNRWLDGTINPNGYRYIESFRLEGTTPVWRLACADALIEKRIWMEHGENTTYVRYELIRGGHPLSLSVKVLVNYRHYHANTHAGDWQMDVLPVENGICITPFEAATPFYLLSGSGAVEVTHEWYRNFDLAIERERGFDDHEDHLHAATFRGTLVKEQPMTLVFATSRPGNLEGPESPQAKLAAEESLLSQWAGANSKAARQAPEWVRQLVLAANQFIVEFPSSGSQRAYSVIAGYPWFTDWGRDTMIALPGLSLVTGRPEIARSILRTYAGFVKEGMIPNFFPSSGEAPQYNSVDAALWFVNAVRQYEAATHDTAFILELFPTLMEIIDSYNHGTRFNIHADPADGLLYAGEPGTQLTWMDAKINGGPVTPRTGKPIEVNALWFNALSTMAELARKLRKSARSFARIRDKADESFQRFWNQQSEYCFDIIDGPEGNDDSLRPNQILAVSLYRSPLTGEQQKKVVEMCAHRLVTSYGLRTLDPLHPLYRGHCAGPPGERDGAYHQGTVWGWLLGHFVLAHLRVYKDSGAALSFLEPMATQLRTYGLGTAGEIFDGDPPFTPRGCIAQAWTVAELLRAWTAVVNRQPRSSPILTAPPNGEGPLAD